MLRNVVNKCNRKLMAAVSLVLAAKWNEPKVTPTIFQMPNPNPNPDPNPNPLTLTLTLTLTLYLTLTLTLTRHR